MKRSASLFLIILVLTCSTVFTQTSVFTYQGKLTNGGTAVDGPYDLQFRLFNTPANGTQAGPTVVSEDVPVVNGIFTVNLDFGNQFPAADERWIDIGVRPGASTGAFTILSPRQFIASSPYAMRSGNAGFADLAGNANYSIDAGGVGGTPAAQIIKEGDLRLTDARAPLAGSLSYVQVSPAIPQAGNFNMAGTGRVGGTLNVDGNATMSANLSVTGTISGNAVNAAAQFNIGGNRVLGVAGANNFFAGVGAGQVNTGTENTFVGRNAGLANNNGRENSFFGYGAGRGHIDGGFNAFFGSGTGLVNRGSENSFFGQNAGSDNSIGFANTFIGRLAGSVNTTGNANVFIGSNANPSSNGLNNATAIGANAVVSQSNSLVLGDASVRVGIGTTAPQYKLHVVGENVRVEGNTTSTLPRFSLNFTGGVADEKKWQNYADTSALKFSALNDAETAETFWLRVIRGAGTSIASVVFPNGNVVFQNGNVVVSQLGAAGSTSLCRNALNQLSTCTFGSLTENGGGESVAAVNALREQLKQQKQEIDELKQVVCTIKPDAAVCTAPGPRL